MAVNFTKNQDEIATAWRKVADSKESQEWALFGYEGNTNIIKLMASGSNGLSGLVNEFNCSLIQYAFCRVLVKEAGINKLVLINWQGDSSPLSRKGLCASHVGDVANYFRGCTQTITIRNDDEATTEYLMDQIVKTSSSKINLSKQLNNDYSPAPNVGSSYKKTDIQSEISSDRKSFWQKQEEEEKERLKEEKKRALEKQAQFEKERKLREESEAKKLAETIRERDRIIEATRQAERGGSLGSQPSSMSSSSTSTTTTANTSRVDDDIDERVGRRSELMRLERNQETLSLISKGLIKDKRAIFEQASQTQQQPQHTHSNLTRRPSGTIVSQRLNTFKSLDCTQLNSNLEKPTNGFSDHSLKLDNSNAGSKSTIIEKKLENVHITNDEETVNSTGKDHLQVTDEKVLKTPEIVDNVKVDSKVIPQQQSLNDIAQAQPIQKESSIHKPIGQQSPSNKEPQLESNITRTETNGDLGIRAKALFDYEAADNTEISFDPDDIIGYIEKVDSGWWQGSVVTGRYSGQVGLFPANYVEELLQ